MNPPNGADAVGIREWNEMFPLKDGFFVVTLESRGPGYAIERFRVETLLGSRPSAELLQRAVEAEGSRGAYFGARWERDTLILYTD